MNIKIKGHVSLWETDMTVYILSDHDELLFKFLQPQFDASGIKYIIHKESDSVVKNKECSLKRTVDHAKSNSIDFVVTNYDLEKCADFLAQGPETTYLMALYCSPIYWLSLNLSGKKYSFEELDNVLYLWQKRTEKCVQMIPRFPSLMQSIELEDVINNFYKFTSEFAKEADRDLAVASSKIAICSESRLGDFIAKLFMWDGERYFSLYDELQSMSHIFGKFQAHLGFTVQELKRDAHKLSEVLVEADVQYRKKEAELEVNSIKLAELEYELFSLKDQKGDANYLSTENRKLKDHLDLADLQIKQLQEELEHYYLSYQDQLDQPQNIMQQQVCGVLSKVYGTSYAEVLNVTGCYEEDGYADLQFLAKKVYLANGDCVESLPFKIFKLGDRLGLEVREHGNPSNFHWLDDYSDEYGRYLRIQPDPLIEHQKEKIEVLSHLNSSEKLRILSLPNLVSQFFLKSDFYNSLSISESAIREWRRNTLTLIEQVRTLSSWLSFDAVTIEEEHRTDSYEHIVLRFINLMIGDTLRSNYCVKLAATDLNSDGKYFTSALRLEFREQSDKSAPIQSWPTNTKDEFGSVLNVDYVLNKQPVIPDNELTQADIALVQHLAQNMPSIISKLDSTKFSRPASDWELAASAILVVDERALQIQAESCTPKPVGRRWMRSLKRKWVS